MLYWVLFLGVMPLLILVLAEMGLGLAGFGADPHLFIPISDGGKEYYVGNDAYFGRFFPPGLGRAPNLMRFPAEKTDGAFRVFVLGASAAMGQPDPAYGLARFIEVMLSARFPEANIEVISATTVAINSHVVRAMALECARHEPDLFIIYLGNNEVVGPYGAGTVFLAFSRSRALIRAGLWFRSLRLGQLTQRLLAALGGGQSRREWHGMAMFMEHEVPADDPRLASVYDHFKANLSDIVRAGLDADAQVMVSTVGCNLRDLPPFASRHRPGITDAELAAWDDHAARAAACLDAGDPHAAVVEFEQALAIDDRHAKLHYRLGRAQLAVNAADGARAAFVRARDLDTLRFRADSRINAVIRDLTARPKSEGMVFVDGAAALDRAAEHGIAGDEFFFEHVHLTNEGAYLVARTLYDHLLPRLPQWLVDKGDAAAAPLTRDACYEHLALTPANVFDQLNHFVSMSVRPPFTNQVDYRARPARLRQRLERTFMHKMPRGLKEARAHYECALQRRPNDDRIRINYAAILSDSGEHEAAVQQYCRVVGNYRSSELYEKLGRALLSAGRHDEALQQLGKAQAINPGSPSICKSLGDAFREKGATDEAIAMYSEALRLSPTYEAVYNNLGLTMADAGRLDEAEQAYRKAIDIHPDYQTAYGNLDALLDRRGTPADRVAAWEAFAKGHPDAPLAHYYEGKARRDANDLEGALAAFRETVTLEPFLVNAQIDLGLVLGDLGDLDGAMAVYEAILKHTPDHYYARNNLGYILERKGEADAAIDEYRRAAAVNADNALAVDNLDKALTRKGDIPLALDIWRKLTADDPDAHRLHYHLAQALEASGRPQDALSAYDRCLRLKPGFERAISRADALRRGMKVVVVEPKRR